MTEHMGMNRTGLQMSPLDSQAMQQYQGPLPVADAERDALGDTRSDYASRSRPLGSVPLPGTMKGALQTGVAMLSGEQPQVLLDKLAERMAFERTGTRLYDALLAKCQALPPDGARIDEDEVLRIRDDEMRHFIQVAQAIEQLGGDPTCMTPSADLAGMEAMGLMQVLSDPRTSLGEALHAILTAELSDQAGWETLIALAEQQNQPELAQMGNTALAEEMEHVRMIRTWYMETLGLSDAMTGTAGTGTTIQSQGKEMQ